MAARGSPALFSYAGRVEAPRPQPLPTRIGGFGGAEGLARFLREEGIGRVVDATHPFAARISRNAAQVCAQAGIPLLSFERPPWRPAPGDDWTEVPDLPAAAQALRELPPERIFLAIGRQNLELFAQAPQHDYLLRLVDPPEAPPPLPRAGIVIARGPFTPEGDLELLRRQRITKILAKNAGGSGAEAKLIAARRLGLPVLLVARPEAPERPRVAGVEEAMDWIHADLGV